MLHQRPIVISTTIYTNPLGCSRYRSAGATPLLVLYFFLESKLTSNSKRRKVREVKLKIRMV